MDDLGTELRTYRRKINPSREQALYEMLTEAADRIAADRARIKALEAENSMLAAGACDVEGGKVGDDHGHAYCTLQKRIAELEAEVQSAFTFAFAAGFKCADETSRQCIPAMDDAWTDFQAARALAVQP